MARNEQQSTARTRIQLDLRPDQVQLLDLLERQLATRSRSDLLQESIGMLLWYVQETVQGRKIVSIDPEEATTLRHIVEIISPSTMFSQANLYRYLVSRSHPWRRQLWLKGRNMTVGQLIATMNVEDMSPEQAADRLELPIDQIREALAYYAANRDLVDLELREEKQRTTASG
jgi:uncharacterized protein (DUF433 family)